MKRAMLVVLLVFAFAGFMMAQTATSTVDVLGAHNNNGRGCAGCHAPHSGAYGSGHLVKSGTDTGSYALWGQDASPLYGQTIQFGTDDQTGGSYAEVLPSSIATGGVAGGAGEIGGILLCLSCHDGNLTATNMMQNKSYEQSIGLLKNSAYGSNPIPTLLGNDGTTAGNYKNDHPVGQNATLTSYGAPIAGATSGLVYTYANGVGQFSVPNASSPYGQFVTSYGFPALAPGPWSNYFGVTATGTPFVLCTTCHNQHVMTVYTSTTASPIAGDKGGKFYATLFFVNGPYNPNMAYNNGAGGGTTAPSTTQFCRQCHFDTANESNNTFGITTQFQ
jgi:hypothetical protein